MHLIQTHLRDKQMPSRSGPPEGDGGRPVVPGDIGGDHRPSNPHLRSAAQRLCSGQAVSSSIGISGDYPLPEVHGISRTGRHSTGSHHLTGFATAIRSFPCTLHARFPSLDVRSLSTASTSSVISHSSVPFDSHVSPLGDRSSCERWHVMRIGKRACALVISLGLPCIGYAQQAAAAPAQADSAMEERLKALEEKVIELEGQLRAMKNAQAYTAAGAAAPATPPATAAGGQAAAESTQAAQTLPQPEVAPARLGGAGGNAKLLNPDIGVIGDFIGSAGYNPIRPTPSLQMHESEVSLQAIIDPYARGDFFISFGEEGVGVEEGYITFTALPAGLVARVGKMRAAFGKVNTLHNHVLPWIDRPLVTENLVGGEDGIDDAGFSVTRAFQAPKGIYLEATGQLFRGDSADVFQSLQRRD